MSIDKRERGYGRAAANGASAERGTQSTFRPQLPDRNDHKRPKKRPIRRVPKKKKDPHFAGTEQRHAMRSLTNSGERLRVVRQRAMQHVHPLPEALESDEMIHQQGSEVTGVLQGTLCHRAVAVSADRSETPSLVDAAVPSFNF